MTYSDAALKQFFRKSQQKLDAHNVHVATPLLLCFYHGQGQRTKRQQKHNKEKLTKFHNQFALLWLCRVIYRKIYDCKDGVPWCCLVRSFHRLSDVLPVALGHLANHVTRWVQHWSGVVAVWSLLCPSNVHLVRPVNAGNTQNSKQLGTSFFK